MEIIFRKLILKKLYLIKNLQRVLSVCDSYMVNFELVKRQGPSVQSSDNHCYSATSADVFSGSQTGFYQQKLSQ